MRSPSPPPPAAHFTCRPRRKRGGLRQLREELLDFLRIVGRIGRDATTEAVHRRAKIVQLGVVDEDKAIVKIVGVRDRQPLVLAVELRDFRSSRLAAILADETHGHARLLPRQHIKDRRVGIRIDDDNLRLRRLDKPRDLADRIKLRIGRDDPARKEATATKGIKDGGKTLLVFGLVKDVTFLQGVNLRKNILMSKKNFAHLYERPHDGDVHLNGRLAFEHAGKHRDPLLRKRIRQVAATATSSLRV